MKKRKRKRKKKKQSSGRGNTAPPTAADIHTQPVS
jgi:hypothetical protein